METPDIRFPAGIPELAGLASVNSLFSGDGSPHRQMQSTGFWNNIPLEEERIHLPPMKPHYGKREVRYSAFGWIDLGELAIFLGIMYTTIGCTHIAIMLMDWIH